SRPRPGLVRPAGRLHDQERARETRTADVPVDLADVAAHLRPDIGIGDDGRAPLELAILLRELVRGRDEHGRVPRFEDRLGARLMVGAGVAVEEQDRAGLDAERVEPLAERLDLVLVERPLDLAVGEHALLDLEPQPPLDPPPALPDEQPLSVSPLDPPDL